MAKRAAPEVNAGSMADIAFLLLIFFLVTTTIPKDSGLNRKLPPIEDNTEPPVIKQKNIFTVHLNNNDQLMVEEELMDNVKNLKAAAIKFLDNGGDGTCSYCQGAKDPASSDNPDKAIISLKNDRETSYKAYITVQNELIAAYNELRNRRALQIGPKAGFPDMNYIEMETAYDDPKFVGNKDKLKEVLDQIKIEIPQKLSEVE